MPTLTISNTGAATGKTVPKAALAFLPNSSSICLRTPSAWVQKSVPKSYSDVTGVMSTLRLPSSGSSPSQIT